MSGDLILPAEKGKHKHNRARMRAGVEGGAGLIHAEALTFALAGTLTRPEAQARVKALCREAQETGTPLSDLAARDFPGTDWASRLAADVQLGTAPTEARAFAAAVAQTR